MEIIQEVSPRTDYLKPALCRWFWLLYPLLYFLLLPVHAVTALDIQQQPVPPRIRPSPESTLLLTRQTQQGNPDDIYIPSPGPEISPGNLPDLGIVPPPIWPPDRPPVMPDPTPAPLPPKRVPNLIGHCSDQAIYMLNQAGITSYQVAPPRLSTEPTGKIISQSPPPGSNFIPRITTLTITPSEQGAASLSLQITNYRLRPGESTRLTAIINPPWPLGSTSYRLLRNGQVVEQNNNGVFHQAIHSPGTYSFQSEATLGPGACGQVPRTRVIRSQTIPVVVELAASPPIPPLPPPTPPLPSPSPSPLPSTPAPPDTGIPFSLLFPAILGLLLLVIVIRLLRKPAPGVEEDDLEGKSDDLKILLEQGLGDMEVDEQGSGSGLDYILALGAGDLTINPTKARLRMMETHDD
jgi:hypothetical protein